MSQQREIADFRRACEDEKDKPVKLSKYIKMDNTELPTIPDMRLSYVVGGGPFMSFDYRIVGGPDNDKRVTLIPWRSKKSLEGLHEKYNGTHEEAENAYGYTSRPAVQYHGALHIATIMFLRGLLSAEREHLMANELAEMYTRMDQEPDVVDQ